MITVTEQAKDLFMEIEHPEGTVLCLDPILDEETGETSVGLASGEPQEDDQIIERDGGVLLRISAPVSEALNGRKLDLVETPEEPAIGLQTPDPGIPTDDS